MAETIDLDEFEKEKAQKYYNFAYEMFPDVEPGFLESKCTEFAFDQEGFNNFLVETMLQKRYPKLQPCTSQALVEITEEHENVFSVPEFVSKYPDPETYFKESDSGLAYVTHSTSFLQDRFRFHSANEIRTVLRKNKFKLLLSYEALKKAHKSRKTPRQENDIAKGIGEPPTIFLDEVDFIKNKEAILQYIEDKQQERELAIAKARKDGTLLSCGCCFSDDLLKEDTIACSEGHVFCRECFKKSIEVQMGEGKIDFPCLEDCPVLFNIEMLKDIIENTMYEKIQKKLQEREIAQANIPGLESCPFCDFYAIPPPESRIFECLSCDKSSCRLCRKESHIPYQCYEVDDVNIKNRTYVEEKMTAALVR